MKIRTIVAASLAALLSLSATAQNAPSYKLYGFIRNYYAFDTRESSAGSEDLYYWMPKDQSLNAVGEDMNAIPSFRYAALTSRLGLDLAGYEVEGYKIGAKFETDFYSGLSGVTGTATLRLRQAYVTVAKADRTWKLGQAWHPMAADLPDIFSLESGAPFGPFSRTPQVTLDKKLGGGSSITASAIWQMQYTSTGPDGAYANYIKYGLTPELFLGYNLKTDKGSFKVGADVLSIKPRNYGTKGGDKVIVNDRLTTVNFFAYGQQTIGDLVVKAKATYGNDGSHFNLIGGYGYTTENEDGSRNYVATHNFSGWATLQYKKSKKVVPSMLIGYVQNLGTSEDVAAAYFKNSCSTIKSMYRIQPEVVYNLGKLQFGLEYMLTSVQYGKAGKRIMAEDNLHWVSNNRIQMMVKYTF